VLDRPATAFVATGEKILELVNALESFTKLKIRLNSGRRWNRCYRTAPSIAEVPFDLFAQGNETAEKRAQGAWILTVTIRGVIHLAS
jgi:hypothetical protein